MRATHLGIFFVVGTMGIGCIAAEEPPTPAPISTSGDVVVEGTATNSSGELFVTPVSAAPPPPIEVALPALADLGGLTTDFCDDSAFEKATYSSKTYGNLVFRYIDGTAAAVDIDSIASVRLAMQEKISDFLGVTSRAPITITMSPNRIAAAKHGHGAGYADAGSSRIDVLYLAETDSYEQVAPGHELTHVIASRVDGATHLPLLDEGLAEYFDGSGRDLHASYVNELRAGSDAASVTRFTDWDVWGDHYGRAGSFVTFLVNRFGRAKFVEFWRAGAITYSGSGYVTKLGDRVVTGADLEKAIDHAASTVYGTRYEAIRLEWESTLAKVMAGATPALSASDRAEIDDLIAHVDDAIARRDPVRFRSTMDGFYCDRKDDAFRAGIARAAVEARGTMRTTVLSAVPTGTNNYPSAIVHAVRRETRGTEVSVNAVRYWVERFPVGWRITSATSW